MFIIREIFHLKFGQYRPVKALLDEAMQKHLLLQPSGTRILTDFTGKGYRLVLELPYATLSAYEADLSKELAGTDWKEWYEKLKQYVEYSEREIMKQIE